MAHVAFVAGGSLETAWKLAGVGGNSVRAIGSGRNDATVTQSLGPTCWGGNVRLRPDVSKCVHSRKI